MMNIDRIVQNQRTLLDAASAATLASLEGSQRLASLQMDMLRESIADSTEACKAMLSAPGQQDVQGAMDRGTSAAMRSQQWAAQAGRILLDTVEHATSAFSEQASGMESPVEAAPVVSPAAPADDGMPLMAATRGMLSLARETLAAMQKASDAVARYGRAA